MQCPRGDTTWDLNQGQSQAGSEAPFLLRLFREKLTELRSNIVQLWPAF